MAGIEVDCLPRGAQLFHEAPRGLGKGAPPDRNAKIDPLANRDVLRAEDLKGLSLLTFDVGFWVGLCRRKLPQTAFLVQTDVDAMDELVSASNLPVFNSDRMLEDGYVPEDSVSIMLDEDFARTVYYVACLDAEKDRYASFFSAVRAETIGAQ